MQEWFQNPLATTLSLGDLSIIVGLVVPIIIEVVTILIPLILTVAYLTHSERKVVGFMQLCVGPNITGPWSLIQPFADVFKLLLREVIRSRPSNRAPFYIGPITSLVPSFAAWVMIPLNKEWVPTNTNIGLLYVLVITSLSAYGVIIASRVSNFKYSSLGAMRASTQSTFYEVAMSVALVYVVMVSDSMDFSDITATQAKGIVGGSVFSWNWLLLSPIFIVYLISAVAKTDRTPFDVAEGESEIVAGHHVEYSGFAFTLFLLAEYIFMILIATLVSLMFLGGWLSPFPQSWDFIDIPSAFWMFVKMVTILYWYLQIRTTLPCYHYDQIMCLGRKVLIPIGFACITILGVWMISPLGLWRQGRGAV